MELSCKDCGAWEASFGCSLCHRIKVSVACLPCKVGCFRSRKGSKTQRRHKVLVFPVVCKGEKCVHVVTGQAA